MDQYQYLSNCTLTPPLPSQLITSKGYCWVKEGVGTKLLSYLRSSIFFTFAIHLYKVSFIIWRFIKQCSIFLFSIILTACLLFLQLCLKKQKKLFFLDQIAFTTWWKISWRSGKRKSSYIIGSLWRRATLEMSALELLYGGQITSSTQFIRPNYRVIPPTDAVPQFL